MWAKPNRLCFLFAHKLQVEGKNAKKTTGKSVKHRPRSLRTPEFAAGCNEEPRALKKAPVRNSTTNSPPARMWKLIDICTTWEVWRRWGTLGEEACFVGECVPIL